MWCIVTDRLAWSVGLSGLSVTLVRPAKTAKPTEMPFGLRTRVGQANHVLDGSPDPPMGRGNFERGKGHSIVIDSLRSSVQKWLNRSRCRLDYGLGWAQGIMLDGVQIPPWEGAIFGERGAHSKV